MSLGELHSLNIILKFPAKKISDDDEFSEWDEDTESTKKNQNTGLQEIRWIKS